MHFQAEVIVQKGKAQEIDQYREHKDDESLFSGPRDQGRQSSSEEGKQLASCSRASLHAANSLS